MKNFLLALPLAAMLTTGCTSDYARNANVFHESFAAGDYASALATAEPMATAAEPNDAVVMKLQLGSIQRAAGMSAAAAKTFEEAEALFSSYDALPEVSLSSEGVSAFTNPYALPYRGRAYDRTMAATYQAMSFLQAGDGANPDDDFPLTDDATRCRFCPYRSLCGRGAEAGNMNAEDDAGPSEEATSADWTVDFDFEQVAEVEF